MSAERSSASQSVQRCNSAPFSPVPTPFILWTNRSTCFRTAFSFALKFLVLKAGASVFAVSRCLTGSVSPEMPPSPVSKASYPT